MSSRIPLTILTGFLGSGKTTLVQALLRRPGGQQTAVIINEFGDIGIDHDLVASSSEDLIALSTGCLCCAMQGGLTPTVRRLLAVRRVERIILETSGLADPTPLLQTAIMDPYLATTVQVANVVVTVDALHGPAVLQAHETARRQVALADRVLITKSDLDAAAATRAADAVRALRPDVALGTSVHGDAAPQVFAAPVADPMAWPMRLGAMEAPLHLHDTAVATASLRREAPMHAVTLTLFLQALAENCGPELWRVKGIVAIRESPERPAVVHGVQHVFHPVTWLEQWPSEDRSTRLVLIGRRVDVAWLQLLLQTIEDEVESLTAS